MKKIILGLGLLLSAFTVFSQPFEVDEVSVNQNGIERMIIEKIDASAVGADMTTYRVFIDMAADYGYQLSTGTSVLGEMSITTTGTWYNNGFGSSNGEDINEALYGLDALLQYDSYVTAGGMSGVRLGVPYSEDTDDGSVDGYVTGSPVNSITTPGLNLTMFGTTSSTTNFQTANGSFGGDPADPNTVGSSVVGPNPSNVVLIGQFTTDGDFAFDLSIQTRDIIAASPLTTPHVIYSSLPDQEPTGTVVSPVNGAIVDKDEVVSIGVHAEDVDGTISQVEFFVNGLSIGIDNTDNGQTDPSLPTHDISWTATGASAEIYAQISDNGGNVVTTASVNISINDPCPISVSLTAPLPGTYDLSDITLSAVATDCDEPVQSVEFLVGNVSVGTDNDGTDGWSINYTPTAGTVSINAVAINSVGASAPSASVQVTFANAAPVVSITSPVTPFDLQIGNDTTFVATASDPDGTVTRVDFLIDGVVVATDNNGADGWSFDYTATAIADFSLEARARDNSNAQTTSAAVQFSVVGGGADAYYIDNVVDFCSSSEVFCMPVVTINPVADIIGYDVEMIYDASDVTPTGVVVVAEELIGDRDWTSYSYNVVGDSLIRISLYLNSTAPEGTTFDGEGTVFCVEFSRNYSFGDVDETTFDINVISESYAGFVLDQSAISGTYSTIRETVFNGSLSFWSDNSPIGYEAGVNLITNIFGDDNPSEIVNPNASGNFVYNIDNGTNITIERDINATTDVQAVVNGYDAYLTSKVTVEDPSFRPNVYQIIAMDVNRDGRVSAGDISQISQRAVGQLDEFAQDWVFIPLTTVLTDLSYRISASYPSADGVGYSRTNVPSVADLIALPIENASTCPIISTENYKGVMLGDVDGSYSSLPASTTLKSAKVVSNEIVLDLSTNSVFASSESTVNAIDFQITLDSKISNVTVKSVAGLVVTSNLVGNKLAVTGYKTGNLDITKALMNLEFVSSATLEKEDVSFALSLINGQPVPGDVIKSNVTSIEELSNNVMVYPNPVRTELFISAEFNAMVSVYNMAGVKLMSQEHFNGTSSLNVENLSSGIYFVEIASETKVEKIRFVVE